MALTLMQEGGELMLETWLKPGPELEAGSSTSLWEFLEEGVSTQRWRGNVSVYVYVQVHM